MKNKDVIDMNLNIGGELIKLKVKFDEQNDVRDAENTVRNFFDRMKKAMPDKSDRNILAMAAYQFALWFNRLNKIQERAVETIDLKTSQLDLLLENKEENDGIDFSSI